jgi:hypothetical protein
VRFEVYGLRLRVWPNDSGHRISGLGTEDKGVVFYSRGLGFRACGVWSRCDKVIETRKLFALFWKNLETHCFR